MITPGLSAVDFNFPDHLEGTSARDIRANGFTTVPEVLRSLTQNSGETQSQQSASGADFSPGAQQVDLRGLGPNHTLVLVNGRRVADFPLPFQGRSNFTDISSIPLGMVDRVEVLTGSASAVYGSDAISGVVNFILKKQADGTTVDVRYGDTTRGGGESYDVSLATGFERGSLNAVIGAELQVQRPLWAYDRAIQDSTKDGPTERSQAARRAFLRTNYDDEYLDPGQAACDALSSLNHGSTYYASRPGFGPYDPILDDYGPGYYCGSDKAIGYGTILSERKGINAYGAFNYTLQNGHQWFADVQLGYHKIGLFRDVTSWSYQAPDGKEDGYFFNQATGQVEYWQRQFSPEEMGGLDRGMIRSTQKTFGIATGFTGPLGGDWDYEATLSHSQYHATIGWPQIVAAAANDLLLGPQLGTDPDGFPIFDADPARLYTPLTRAQYDAISGRSTYHPTSRTDTVSLTLTTAELFSLPAGWIGDHWSRRNMLAIFFFGCAGSLVNPLAAAHARRTDGALWVRRDADDRTAALAKTDAPSAGRLAIAADDDLVTILQEGAGLAVGQRDRLGAPPAPLQQAAPFLFLRAGHRPAARAHASRVPSCRCSRLRSWCVSLLREPFDRTLVGTEHLRGPVRLRPVPLPGLPATGAGGGSNPAPAPVMPTLLGCLLLIGCGWRLRHRRMV